MTTYGVTAQGFVRPTVQDLVTAFEVDELADMGEDTDVSPELPIGQLNGIVGRQLGIAWEALEVCYYAFDPDATEGRLLEMLSKLTGTFRQGNTPSEVVLACNLDDTTVLPLDVAYAAIENKPDIRWKVSPVAHPSGYTAVGDGSHDVTFVSELLGPIAGFAGTINVIATPIVGWNSVVNANDAELGLQTDNDPALRTRRERELATIGSATVRAITANVAQAFPGKIQTLIVFENEGDNTDENGLPPHSLETLIFDGDVPSVDDDALAQVILNSKAGGIQTSGNTTGQAAALVNGIETLKDVKFTRAAQIPVYLIIDLVRKPGAPYVGDVALAQNVATNANAYFGPGDEIVEDRIRTLTMEQVGVKDILSVKLGLLAPPTLSANLPMSIREIGRFSSARIVVNS